MEKLGINKKAGEKLFMLGNEAFARGAIEAGVQVVAAYPGTPSSEITERLAEVAKELNLAHIATGDMFREAQKKGTKLALEAVIKELMRFKKETISSTELTKAREMSKGQLTLRLEDSRHVAGWLGGQGILTGRILTLDDVNSLVDAVTASDIKKLAGGLIDRSKMRLAVVGPSQKSEPLRKLVEG